LTAPTIAKEAIGSGARRRARIAALQTLYELDNSNHTVETVATRDFDDLELSEDAADYYERLVEGVFAHGPRIDKIVTALAPSWPIRQMAMVDRNILRVAVFEIVMSDEAPPKVAINEAVEIAKIFGADSARKFVNGVLGSVMEYVDKRVKA